MSNKNPDIIAYRYKCKNGIITKDKIILKYEGMAIYNTRYYRAYNTYNCCINGLVIHEDKLNKFKASVCYFTEEKDNEVLEYYKNRYEFIKRKAKADLEFAEQCLSVISIVEKNEE